MKAIFDTNLLIDWIQRGDHEDLLAQRLGLSRHMSAVVAMELRAGTTTATSRRQIDSLVSAFARTRRLIAPPVSDFVAAGALLERLRRDGVEVRRASLVNDVLIALTARSIGATLFTRDADFERLREHVDFQMELVSR